MTVIAEKVWFDPVHRRVDFGSFKSKPVHPWVPATLSWDKTETESQKRRKRLENAARNVIRKYPGKHGEKERESDIAELMGCYDLIHSQSDRSSEQSKSTS